MSLVSMMRWARSRRPARRSRSLPMPSMTLPPPASGCRRRVSLKRRTSASFGRLEEHERVLDAALVQLVEQLLEPAEVLAAADVADHRDAVHLAALAAEQVDERRHELRRQVVDAEPAGVLERVHRLRLPGAREPRDDHELQRLGHVTLPSDDAHALERQQALLPGRVVAVRAEPAVVLDDPVARQDHREGVARHGGADGAVGVGAAGRGREVAVARDLAVGHPGERPVDVALEVGEAVDLGVGVDVQREGDRLSGEVALEVRGPMTPAARRPGTRRSAARAARARSAARRPAARGRPPARRRRSPRSGGRGRRLHPVLWRCA